MLITIRVAEPRTHVGRDVRMKSKPWTPPAASDPEELARIAAPTANACQTSSKTALLDHKEILRDNVTRQPTR